MASRHAIAARLAERIRAGALVRELEAFWHPGQRRFELSPTAYKALLSTRRYGKSAGRIRGVLKRALLTPNARIFCINETREEVRRIVWQGGNNDGLSYLLDRLAIVHDFNKTDLRLALPNGAIVQLVGADDERQVNKLRGTPFHELWPDEAQKLRHLDALINEVASASQKDFGGSIILTGTPSEDISSMFYRITRQDGKRDRGWEVHEGSVTENPWFGATPAERYQRVIQAELDRTGKLVDDPVIQRELFGRWVLTDARYVYPVHRVPPHELHYAPVRALGDGRIDIAAAVADLPTDPYGRPREWRFAIGADLGYSPDPFAIVVWAFAAGHRGLYEIGSWCQTKLIPDQQLAELERVYRDCCLFGPVAEFVADAGGAKGVVAGWALGYQERTGIPISEAKKSNKRTHIDLFGGDIESRRVFLREGGVLSQEMHSLPWKVTGTGEYIENDAKAKDGSKKYPNHAADAALYIHRAIAPYLNWEIIDEPKTKDQIAEERIAEHLENYSDEDEWLPL